MESSKIIDSCQIFLANNYPCFFRYRYILWSCKRLEGTSWFSAEQLFW